MRSYSSASSLLMPTISYSGTTLTLTPRSSIARLTASTISGSADDEVTKVTVSPGLATPRPAPWTPVLVRASGRTCGSTSSTDEIGFKYEGKRGSGYDVPPVLAAPGAGAPEHAAASAAINGATRKRGYR